MSLNLDVVIDTKEQSVDMKAGLETLQGVSDATRCIAETILTEKLPKRLWHKDKVRTTLRKNFKGSYGHIFSLDIYDDALKKRFARIGKSTFAELISYFINESLYIEPLLPSGKAQQIINKLGDASDDLIKQLRVSSLESIHEISIKFNHDVKIRYRKNRVEQTILGEFNRKTALVLQAEESTKTVDVTVSITRLNIFTGNGRLALKDVYETVAFGFGVVYKEVKIEAKKLFSENLDHNNGINKNDWKYLKIKVAPVKLKDGKIVKYIIKGIYND